MCARRKVTLLSEDLLHGVHSEFDTLFFLLHVYSLGVCDAQCDQITLSQ